ncbi:hypothetical protein EMCRGX_G029006 [Ephydatia muelleri]
MNRVLALFFAAAFVDLATPAFKGIGLSESNGFGAAQLQAIGATWYYSWSETTAVTNTSVPFVPMVFSAKHVATIGSGHPYLLGFNEPDNSAQSNMNVSFAVSLWPQVAASGTVVGGPATASNPVTPGNWQPDFMGNITQLGLRVDFTTLHWYKNANPESFINDVISLCNRYSLPVWITEFAPQTTSASQTDPYHYTQDQPVCATLRMA